MDTVEEVEQDPVHDRRRKRPSPHTLELGQADAARPPRRSWSGRRGIVAQTVVATSFVVLIATGCGSQKGTATQKGAATPNRAHAKGTAAEVTSLLAGIPQRGNTLGYPNAPVTIQYFGDLQCPFCRQFTLGALPSLISSYVRGGKLKIEYRSLESATRNPETFKTQQVAALAAGTQNKMWSYLELFYHEQGKENSGYVTERFLQGLAQQVPGLNLPAWSAARSQARLARTVSRDADTAFYARLSSTPAFRIGRAGGRWFRLRPDTLTKVTPYATAIEELLRFGYPRRLLAPRKYV